MAWQKEITLLWELLSTPAASERAKTSPSESVQPHLQRLPFDKRCIAITKSGKRCRGHIRAGKEWCVFHDPELVAKRRQSMAARGNKRIRRLSHLPDGYLRKLTNITTVGHAMDRLYREVRLGIITPEMGRVMFSVLTRLLDSGLVGAAKRTGRSRADRMRPKLSELLTRAERAAWREAIANAPPGVLRDDRARQPVAPSPGLPAKPAKKNRSEDSAVGLTLQVAS